MSTTTKIIIAVAIVIVWSVLEFLYILPPRVRMKGDIVVFSSTSGAFSKSFSIKPGENVKLPSGYSIENSNGNIILSRNGKYVRTVN